MTPRSEPVIPLSEATDVAIAGAKAAALARATADGYRVPDGAVITAAAASIFAVDSGATDVTPLAGLVDLLGGAVAVRSSAIEEDGAGASFAGQYETVLDVTSDEGLVEAIVRCMRSAESPAASTYRLEAHIPGPSMAILIQRMLHPTAAGAAFSADPVTGDNHVVIEATSGRGDGLLAGEITGERWVVDAKPAVDGHSREILSTAEANEIAALCRSLADRRGRPVDIEWGIEGGELWLLQVRPITALPLEPTLRLPDSQTFLREPRVQFPIHPFSFSSWFPVHGDIFAQVFQEFGVPVAGLDNRYHLGRVYTRTVPLMDRGTDGDDPPTFVLKALMRLVPAMRRRTANALRWDGDGPIETLIEDWEREGRAWTVSRTRELRDCALTGLTDFEIAGHINEVQRHLRRVALDHFRLSFGALAIPMGRLGLFVEEHLGWATSDVFTLVQGHGRSSVAQGKAIGELAESLGTDGIDAAVMKPSSLLDNDVARIYLARFGHIVHLDLTKPTEADDPRILATHLRRYRDNGQPQNQTDPTAAASEAEQRALLALASADDRAEFTRLLALARRGRPYGDETEGMVLTALSLMRAVGLEVGRRWAETGRLRDAADVWFIELDEMSSMLRSPSAPPPDVERRRRELRWAQAHPAPERFGPEPSPMPPPSIVAAKYRSTLGAGFWAFAHMEGRRVPQPDEVHLLHGLPGSPGTATGNAKILRSETEFARVEPGDIVICAVTTASWSPIFGVIGGLVTENGGPLSHPATLAREYGLPAVLSAPDATRRIAEGVEVRIDGAGGVVEILG